ADRTYMSEVTVEATVSEVWRKREEWAKESRIHKKRQQNARFFALLCGALGAILGTYASFVKTAQPAFGVLSGILITLSGYFGKELRNPEAETYWARARMLAEALKRECWLFLMGVPPFDKAPTRVAQLKKRAEDLTSNMGLDDPKESIQGAVVLPKAD